MRFLGSWSSRFVLLAAVLFAIPASAQVPEGRITGTVRNARGEPIAAARVTAVHNTTRATRTTATAADGSYTLSGLASGTYTVSATLFGYRRSSRADVQVSPPGAASVDFALEPLPLQAITVTATLREQELADIPFSIAAPTASVLRDRGADNLEMIAANVAGFSVQNLGPGQSQVAMRGASSGQIARDQPGVKEQVGAYLDDSPVSLSLFTPDLDLFDISRVEVLRGPQGTLFGAGSLAGTVRYITNQPQLGLREVFGEVGGSWIGGGNAGGNFKVGANVPFTERVAGRIALYHSRFGGWMDAVQPNLTIDENVNTGERSGVRAAMNFSPNGRLTIIPRLVVQKVKMDGWNRIDTFNILANPFTTTRPKVTLGERRLFTQMDEPFTDDFVLGDVNLRYDFGRVNLTSITSYSYRDILVVRDATALTASITGGNIGLSDTIYTLDAPLDDATVARVFTQEARLAGGTERRRWLLGAFYSKILREYGQSLIVQGFQAATGIGTSGPRAARDELFFSDLDYDMRQVAVFGEGTVNLGGRLDLTAGLRYYDFSEDRTQVFDGIFADPSAGPGTAKANGFAPRVIASFKASDNVTLNAQASQGFRLGGINDPLNRPLCTPEDSATFSGRDTWKDETAWNYEVGTKSQWMGGRASLNLSAFYMDISDLQLVVTAGSCSSRLIFNVPKAVSQGAEIELAMAPNQNFDFSVAATFSDAEVRSTLTSTAGGVTTVVSGIEDGNRLPSVPKLQATAAATYRRPLRPGSNGFVTGTFQHIGDRITQIDDHALGFPATLNMDSFNPNTIGGPLTQNNFVWTPLLPAYNVVNLRTGIARPNWEWAFYINNVTDERAFLALDRERGTRARIGFLTNQPRTFGVSMAFNH